MDPSDEIKFQRPTFNRKTLKIIRPKKNFWIHLPSPRCPLPAPSSKNVFWSPLIHLSFYCRCCILLSTIHLEAMECQIPPKNHFHYFV